MAVRRATPRWVFPGPALARSTVDGSHGDAVGGPRDRTTRNWSERSGRSIPEFNTLRFVPPDVLGNSADSPEAVVVRDPAASGAPLLAAVLAVLLAVGYGVVLGHALRVPDPGPAVSFVLYFAGLGAGVAFAVRCCPTAAGIGAFAFATVPALFTWVAPRTGGSQPIVALDAAGGIAFGVFLLAVAFETLARSPGSLGSLVGARDAVAGALVGLVVTLAVFVARTPTETVYRSLWVQLLGYVFVAAWGLFLVATAVVPVLFLTRRRVFTPALLVGAVYGLAALPGGTGYTVWSATPGFLAEYGVVLLALAVAAGFVELAVDAFVGRLLQTDPIPVGR